MSRQPIHYYDYDDIVGSGDHDLLDGYDHGGPNALSDRDTDRLIDRLEGLQGRGVPRVPYTQDFDMVHSTPVDMQRIPSCSRNWCGAKLLGIHVTKLSHTSMQTFFACQEALVAGKMTKAEDVAIAAFKDSLVKGFRTPVHDQLRGIAVWSKIVPSIYIVPKYDQDTPGRLIQHHLCLVSGDAVYFSVLICCATVLTESE